MQATTDKPQVEQKPAEQIRTLPDFGSGRYSAFGLEVFKDSVRILHLSLKQAEKLARSAMSDFGDYLKLGTAKISVGAFKKGDSTFTIREAATVKGCLATPAITIVKLLKQLQDCRAVGLKFDGSHFKLDETLAKWLE